MDTVGVRQLKINKFPAKFVFLTPPSPEVLEHRLRTRGTESEEQIKVRLKNSNDEMKYGFEENNFDKVIVNKDLDETCEELIRYIRINFNNFL